MTIKRLVAWTDLRAVVLRKTPTVDQLLKNQATISKSLEALISWLDTNKKPKLSEIKPLVDLFGYDPYTGEHYRALLIQKPKSIPKVGETLLLEVSDKTLSSWTQDEQAALRYAEEVLPDYVDKNVVGWAVVRAEAPIRQVMTPNYAELICQYITDTVEDSRLLFTAEELLEMIDRYRDEKEVLVEAPRNLRVKILHAGTF